MKTKIEWADESSQPIKAVDPRTGKTGWHCVKIDTACKNCYAATFNMRRLPNGGTGLDYVATSPAVTYLDRVELNKWLEWKAPRVVFPCSMTDWCGEFVDQRFSAALIATASMASRHTFLFLTKRPHLCARLLDPANPWRDRFAAYCKVMGLQFRSDPIPNVWLGYSAGTQKTYDEGLPSMQQLARWGWNTWCSCEPMLEAMDFHLADRHTPQWFVFGGESGPKARPFDVDGCRDAIEQCDWFGRLVFLKQFGRHVVGDWSSVPAPVGTPERWFLKAAKGNDPQEWPADLQGRREYPFQFAT